MCLYRNRIFSDVFTWIDANYAVHGNMKSRTGWDISMVYSIIHGKPLRQKININSSLEAELLGVSEFIPYNLWLMMFLEYQGYSLDDNESEIPMGKNGRNSYTRNLQHISVWYFLIKDTIEKVEVEFECCTKYIMLAY